MTSHSDARTSVGEVRASLALHLPGYESWHIRRMGEGTDHIAYDVGGQMVVRLNKATNAVARREAVRRDFDLLSAVSEFSALPTPTPIFADAEAGILAYRKLPGFPLLDRPAANPVRLAAPLGEFVSGLRKAPVETMKNLVEREEYPMEAWLRDAVREYREVSDLIPGPARRSVENFLESSPPAEPRVSTFCHNDLGVEHILVDGEDITGVIDWTDAAITDPSRDLALIYRDLGPEVFEEVLVHYAHPLDDAERERAVFYARCKLIEDIAYSANSGDLRYVEAGLENLARTFA